MRENEAYEVAYDLAADWLKMHINYELILSEEELKNLPRPVRTEAVVKPKIMYFGPGAFFRSFVASLTNSVNRKDAEKWGNRCFFTK